AKLVDAPDLGSGAARCESSSLSFRTIIEQTQLRLGFVLSAVHIFIALHVVCENKKTNSMSPLSFPDTNARL
ncbi:hypothetical protein M2G50_09120, partial [Vibrio vulnificus]|uniref:hypothetical protein n=2 Tax=Vibrio vulnificus TaxID=672 RepID=UPI001CDC7DEC